MPVPPLTAQQRRQALDRAARARRERAEAGRRLKRDGVAISEVIASAATSDAIAKMKVVTLIESMPGTGRVKAGRIMDELGIAPSRRVRGLGRHQAAALIARFEPT